MWLSSGRMPTWSARRRMARVRLISGEFGGRFIETPGDDSAHPMSERARAAIFNQLDELVVGARVLDAFAGSGALGFEALSRGAENVVFVDRSPRVVETLEKNAESLGVGKRFFIKRFDLCSLVRGVSQGSTPEGRRSASPSSRVAADSLSAAACETPSVANLEKPPCYARTQFGKEEPESGFDLVFADPPYGAFDAEVIGALAGLLAPGGHLIVSYPKGGWRPELPGLELVSDRTYAGAGIAHFLYKNRAN